MPSSYRVLILGATGMLGHVLFSVLSERKDLEVLGTARKIEGLGRWFPALLLGKIRGTVDAAVFDSVLRVVQAIRPEVVINCIGIVKQLPPRAGLHRSLPPTWKEGPRSGKSRLRLANGQGGSLT